MRDRLEEIATGAVDLSERDERAAETLDARWPTGGPEKVILKLIGSAVLMLKTNYVRVTKDADVLEREHFGLGPTNIEIPGGVASD